MTTADSDDAWFPRTRMARFTTLLQNIEGILDLGTPAENQVEDLKRLIASWKSQQP